MNVPAGSRWLFPAAALAVAALLIASAPPASAREDVIVRFDRKSEALVYDGPLTQRGFARLRRRHAVRLPAPRWLIINSDGGEVNLAMDIGEWVYDQALNVRVRNRCMSACANYIFTAARMKHIEPGAVVAWHGSTRRSEQAIRDGVDGVIERDILPHVASSQHAAVRDKLMTDTLSYMQRAREREQRFFARIGVDERITTIGEGRAGISDFWFLSVASMARFGVTNVTAPANYPETDTRRFGERVVVYLDPGTQP